MADREPREAVGDDPGLAAGNAGPALEDDLREAVGYLVHERTAPGGEERQQLVAGLRCDHGLDHGMRLGGHEKDLDRGSQGCPCIRRVRADRRLDRRDEPVPLAEHVCLRELLARAERVVERLTAHARGEGDLGHRRLGPGLRRRYLADRIEHPVAQELSRRVGERLACRLHYSSATGSKSTLSRTPQSGQFQSSGISLHGVPGGNPSRVAPSASI